MNYNQRDVDPQGGGAPAESDRDGGLRSDKLRGAIGLLRKPLDAQGLGSWESRNRKEGKPEERDKEGMYQWGQAGLEASGVGSRGEE